MRSHKSQILSCMYRIFFFLSICTGLVKKLEHPLKIEKLYTSALKKSATKIFTPSHIFRLYICLVFPFLFSDTFPFSCGFETQDPEFSTKASDDYIDYKGRKADPKKHGGIRAACLVCGK